MLVGSSQSEPPKIEGPDPENRSMRYDEVPDLPDACPRVARERSKEKWSLLLTLRELELLASLLLTVLLALDHTIIAGHVSSLAERWS